MRRPGLLAGPAAVAVIVLAGCGAGEPALPRDCERVLGSSIDAVLPSARLVVDEARYQRLECEWRGGQGDDRSPRLAVRFLQPTSYADPPRTRADSTLAHQWEKDDEQHVTVAVAGVGISAYRFTRIAQDRVLVTVRAYRGFRELTLELQAPYPGDREIGALEDRAVAAARAAMSAT